MEHKMQTRFIEGLWKVPRDFSLGYQNKGAVLHIIHPNYGPQALNT